MNENYKIYPIQKTEITQAVNTLHLAFRDDPLMLWIFGNQSNYQTRGKSLLLPCIQYCILYGIVYRTENFEAVALRRKPGDLKMSFWRLIRSGMIKTPSMLGKEAFDRLMLFVP